jgi:hypothetical protein
MGVAGEEFDGFYVAMNLAVSAARRARRRTVALGRLGPSRTGKGTRIAAPAPTAG